MKQKKREQNVRIRKSVGALCAHKAQLKGKTLRD